MLGMAISCFTIQRNKKKLKFGSSSIILKIFIAMEDTAFVK